MNTMRPLPRTRSCFACGKHNPHGLQLAFRTDGSTVQTRWTPREHHSGFIDTIHGGILATVLDEIMAWTCGAVGGRFAYSIDIGIRYAHPLRPGEETTGTGRILENRRGRIFRTEARLSSRGNEIATASGTYLAIRKEDEVRLREDLGEEGEELWEMMKSLRQ